MRRWLFVVLAVGAFASPVLAQRSPQPSPTGDRTAGPSAQGQRGAAPGRTAVSRPGNDAAQREAAEREKRWDERMKRVTRSLCVGC